jgi:hypothetical protein
MAGISSGVLQVRVDRDDDIPTDDGEARDDRRVLTVVPGEFEDPDAVAPDEPFQHLEGVVPAAVVDVDDLVRLPRLAQRRLEPVHQEEEVLLLVVDGDDDGNHGRPPGTDSRTASQT